MEYKVNKVLHFKEKPICRPIHIVIKNQNYNKLEEMIKKGVDLNKNDSVFEFSPLFWSIIYGNNNYKSKRILKLLLKNNAKFNLKNNKERQVLNYILVNDNNLKSIFDLQNSFDVSSDMLSYLKKKKLINKNDIARGWSYLFSIDDLQQYGGYKENVKNIMHRKDNMISLHVYT